jgi:hypothetical protein
MNKNMFTLAALFSLLLISSTHAQTAWKKYTNAAYGYSIPIPANLHLQERKGDPAGPWQAKTFHSKDGNVSLVISTHWTNGRTPQELFSDEVSRRQSKARLSTIVS